MPPKKKIKTKPKQNGDEAAKKTGSSKSTQKTKPKKPSAVALPKKPVADDPVSRLENANKKLKAAAEKNNPYALVGDVSGKGNFVVYTLLNGDVKAFVSPVEAREFAAEHQEVINSENTFSTKSRMDAFLAASVFMRAGTTVTAASMSPQDKTNFNTIRVALEQNRPHSEIKLYFKTTKRSEVVLVFFCATTAGGQPVWWFKRPMDALLAKYFQTLPTTSEFANDLLTTLTTVEARDPEKGPNDVLVSIRKKDNRAFPQFVIYGWAKINVTGLSSSKHEAEWISDSLHTTWNLVQQESKKPVFVEAMKTAFTEAMYKAMTKESDYGPNFSQWMSNCRIVVSPLDNLNTLVVLDKSKDLQLFLCKNEWEHKKYPNDDLRGDYGTPTSKEPTSIVTTPRTTPKLTTATSPGSAKSKRGLPRSPKPKVTPPSPKVAPPKIASPKDDKLTQESDASVSLHSTDTEEEDDDYEDDDSLGDPDEPVAEVVATVLEGNEG